MAASRLSADAWIAGIAAIEEGPPKWTPAARGKSRRYRFWRGAAGAGVPVVAGASSGIQVIALRSYLNPLALLSASFVVFIMRYHLLLSLVVVWTALSGTGQRRESALRAFPSKPNRSMLTSTMKIDLGAQVPLYEQVAAELRRAIADGEVKPGQRMPLAKDLAAVLGVNKNTVLRALRQLRDEGLLEFRRGRGITVAGTPQRGAVMSKVRELVAFGREQGYRPEELVAMIEEIS